MAMYGTYMRLGVTAADSWRTVVRAAARKLAPLTRRDPAQRAARHRFYREMLAYHRRAQEIVWIWRL